MSRALLHFSRRIAMRASTTMSSRTITCSSRLAAAVKVPRQAASSTTMSSTTTTTIPKLRRQLKLVAAFASSPSTPPAASVGDGDEEDEIPADELLLPEEDWTVREEREEELVFLFLSTPLPLPPPPSCFALSLNLDLLLAERSPATARVPRCLSFLSALSHIEKPKQKNKKTKQKLFRSPAAPTTR